MKTTTNAAFDNFLHAATCKAVLLSFYALCESLAIEYPPTQNETSDHCTFYSRLKKKLHSSWKAQSLFTKLDKRFMCKEYFVDGRTTGNRYGEKISVLIIGAGPCGLRTAIEMALLGAKTVLVEKRDAFSRNNVLHLWPYNIADLKGIGAKKFFGRFCAGAIDHISIRQLQLLLLKASLLLGVEIHVETSFIDVISPKIENNEDLGWRALVEPKTSPVSFFNFDVIIGADGKRNTLEGFKRKCFRGKLAIGITANFMNMRTTAEASVEEISGVAYIFNQQFFKDLRNKTHIDLENIVYYKDDTHYFVMTAKKHSLLKKGVLLHDHDCLEKLLSHKNVDQKALMNYAKEAANFSTNYKLPNMKFAVNTYGQPDVAVFDFTAMYAAENATMFREVNGHKLLAALVGDSLLEPFWPLGTGCARGFFAAFDTAWMIRSWCAKTIKQKNPPENHDIELEVLKEREALYRLLHQTTPDNTSKNIHAYTINPSSRYPKINYNTTNIQQVRSLYLQNAMSPESIGDKRDSGTTLGTSLTRNVSFVRSNKLLAWCRTILKDYRDINVTNMAQSWKDGMALCGIIHRYRPDLIPFAELDRNNSERNNQLAFDIAEQHFGISPVLSGKEMAESAEVDNLLMITYLSQFYEIFKKESPPLLSAKEDTKEENFTFLDSAENDKETKEEPVSPITSTSPVGLLTRFTQRIKRKSVPKKSYTLEKKRKNSSTHNKNDIASNSDKNQVILKSTKKFNDANKDNGVKIKKATESLKPVSNKEPKVTMRRNNSLKADVNQRASNRISSLGLQLISKFENNVDVQNHTSSSKVCHFCNKFVYIMERNSVAGVFFHRNCFVCSYCSTTLRMTNYKRNIKTGKFYCEAHYKGQLKADKADKNVEEIDDEVEIETHSDCEHTEELDDVLSPMVEVASTVNMRSKRTPERIELENMRLSMMNNRNELSEEDFNELNFSQSVAIDNDYDSDATDTSSDTDDSFYMDAMDNGTSSQDLLTSYHEKLSKNALLRESLKEKKSADILKEEESFMDATESYLGNTENEENVSLLSSTSTETDADLLDDELSNQLEEEVSESPQTTPKKEQTYSNHSSPQNNILFNRIGDITSNESIMGVQPSPPLPSKHFHPEKSNTNPEAIVSSDINFKTFTPYLASEENKPSNKAIILAKAHSELHHSDSMDKIQNYIATHPITDDEKESSALESKQTVQQPDNSDNIDFANVTLNNTRSTSASSNVSVSSYSSKDTASVSSYKSDEDDVIKTSERSKIKDANARQNNANILLSNALGNASYQPSWNNEIKSTPKLGRPVSSDVRMTFEYMQKKQRKRLQVRKEWFESQEDDLQNESDAHTPVRTNLASNDSDLYFTPLGDTPMQFDDDDTYYSFNTTNLHNTIDSLTLDETISDINNTTRSPASPVRRKLPMTPGKRSLPVLPLPKLPIYEAQHSTARDDSDANSSGVEGDLLKHEARVQARVQKMKKALNNKPFTSTPLALSDNKSDYSQNKSLEEISEEGQTAKSKVKPKIHFKKKLKVNDKLKTKKSLFSPKKKNKNWRINKSVDAQNTSKDSPSTSVDVGSISLTDDMTDRISKKVELAAIKLAKIEKQKRLRRAHVIQRQLEEVEVKQRQLEQRGVELEKTLRVQKPNENSLYMQEWFKLVQERNGLLRYENELMIYQRELQLEDRQSKLKEDWRSLVALPHSEKNSQVYSREKEVLKELLEVVQQRDELVGLLDEQRQKEKEEGSDIESIMMSKFSQFSEGKDVFVV